MLKCFNNNNLFHKLIINGLISGAKYFSLSSIMDIMIVAANRVKKQLVVVKTIQTLTTKQL